MLKYSGPDGAILTGVTGIPIAQSQVAPAFKYFSIPPPGVITAVQQKGMRPPATRRAAYYYPAGVFPGAARSLFSMPQRVQTNLIVSYEHEFYRHRVTVQLNVNNLFNHYQLVLMPNVNTGWSSPSAIKAAFWGQPRFCQLSTTIDF